jgi:hypothetical protein
MVFKSCTCCPQFWESRVDFILSSSISLHGYQPALNKPENGLFLFNHDLVGCGTTLAVRVNKFSDLYKGPHYGSLEKGTERCSGKCLISIDLDRCDAKCSVAYVREIMQIILHLKSNQKTTQHTK